MNHVPWHGVVVATALPLRDDLSPDYQRYADHVRWLLANGCDGVCPNGSLGEYQTLTDVERATVVRTAVEVAGPDRVLPGVSAYGSLEAVRWAEQAAEAGCQAVMSLPPNTYRADDDAVVEHFRAVASVGLPVVAYNNPYDTKVDLTPELLARLHGDGLIRAVKEFSGDVRRGYRIAELAPGLEVVIGADDVTVELALSGAVGWIAGFPNALPAACVALYRAATGADPASALPAYRLLHPLLRWDSRTEFVQAIKLSMDVAGRYGGRCRPPRSPLPDDVAAGIRAATEKVLAEGLA
jgi:4-hydroxy-tetrahydrodipicolinate synthase